MMGSCRCCVDRSILHQLCLVPDRRVPVQCPECGEPCLNVGCANIKSYPSPILALNAVFEFVRNVGRPDTYMAWRVENYDGCYGSRFDADGKVEVCLYGYERPVDPTLQHGREIHYPTGGLYKKIEPIFIILEYDNYVQAQVAGATLNDAFAKAERVRELFPTDNDGCDEFGHIVKLEWFSRRLPMRAVCERCMAVLKDEVHPHDYDAGGLPHGVTVAKLIENEVNHR